MTTGTLRERLLGTWRLVGFDARGVGGPTLYPMGPTVEGLLMYLPDGYMSVQMMVPNRPPYAGGDVTDGTASERAAAAEGYLAYAGRWEVDEGASIVRHSVELSLVPNWLDTVQLRYARLDGTQLELRTAPLPFAGGEAVVSVRWTRAT